MELSVIAQSKANCDERRREARWKEFLTAHLSSKHSEAPGIMIVGHLHTREEFRDELSTVAFNPILVDQHNGT